MDPQFAAPYRFSVEIRATFEPSVQIFIKTLPNLRISMMIKI